MTITMILLIIVVINAITIIAFVYVAQYYAHLKSQKINDSIKSLVNDNQNNIMENIKSALIEHNQLCLEIHNYNKITKRTYTYLIFILIPMNLI